MKFTSVQNKTCNVTIILILRKIHKHYCNIAQCKKVVNDFGKDYCSCQSKGRCGQNHDVGEFSGLSGGKEEKGSVGGL